MGKNPSGFKGAGSQAPVERVSWADVQGFCQKVGGALGLPSEAQWEYACRAGTQGMSYAGDFEIKGKNNAPQLDKIAWYGGNSGVDYSGGYDSSGLSEKQYAHERAGTHPVGKKKPNAWGLHDMLGNVWEWCRDRFSADYYAQNEQDGMSLFVMKYRAGRSLDQVLRPRKPLKDVDMALYILVQVARALEVLWAGYGVHRYIQPSKIYLDFDGRVWLGGFNLAKWLSQEAEDLDDDPAWEWVQESLDLRPTIECYGNPCYMAPEQAAALAEAVYASDLWSWSILAYRLLTGFHPLEDPNDRQSLIPKNQSMYRLLIKKQYQRRSLVELRPQLQDELQQRNLDIERLDAILARNLQADPARRYQDPSELLAALAALLKERRATN